MAEEKKDGPKKKRPQAIKRDIQSEKKRLHNRSYKAKVGTAIKDLQTAIDKKEPTSKERLQTVYSLMDKGVKTGMFKANKAARTKSRLTQRVAKSLA